MGATGVQLDVTKFNHNYRASSLGSCTKSLIAARIGYEPKDVFNVDVNPSMSVLEEGNIHEKAIVERLTNEGWLVSRAQEELAYVLPGFNVVITGHIDGIIQWMGDIETWTRLDLSNFTEFAIVNTGGQQADPLLLEIKTMSDGEYKKYIKTGWNTPGLIQKYKWQTSFYMHRLNIPMMFYVKNRNSGAFDVDFVRSPFYSWSDIVQRITAIEIAAKNNELPETCDSISYPCPFDFLHVEEEIEIGDDLFCQMVDDFLMFRESREKLASMVTEQAEKIAEKMGHQSKLATLNATVTKKVKDDKATITVRKKKEDA